MNEERDGTLMEAKEGKGPEGMGRSRMRSTYGTSSSAFICNVKVAHVASVG
jgi:hypothetical protein